MSTTRKFQGRAGGSAATAAATQEGNSKIMLFGKDVRYLFPHDKKALSGRILPSFDYELSVNDPGFKSAWAPYRDLNADAVDPDTKTTAFSSWFALTEGYRFFGKGGYSFFSPQTLRILGVSDDPADCADPIQDVRTLIWDKYKETEMKAILLDKPKEINAKAVLPRPSLMALLNYHYMDLKDSKRGWNTDILVVANGALVDLKRQLSWPTPRSVTEPHDKNFENYLFGDVTDPTTGLVAKIARIKMDGFTTHGFQISDSPYSMDGATTYPIGKKILETRHNLLSSDTLIIKSYQEIVDILVYERLIPYELLDEACGNNANISSYEMENPIYFPGNAHAGSHSAAKTVAVVDKEEDDDLNMDAPPEPAARASTPKKVEAAKVAAETPAKAASVALPTKPKVESKPTVAGPDLTAEFWVTGFGAPKGSRPLLRTGKDILGLVEDGGVGKIMPKDKSATWATPDAFGLVIEPPAVEEEEAPEVPDDDDAPEVPDDAPDAPSEGSSALDSDERARYDRYAALVKSGQVLEAEQVMDYVTLMTKFGNKS